MTVAEIERAVAELTRSEPAAFRASFAEFDADRWEEEIAGDAASGKLDKLAEEAARDYRKGDGKEL